MTIKVAAQRLHSPSLIFNDSDQVSSSSSSWSSGHLPQQPPPQNGNPSPLPDFDVVIPTSSIVSRPVINPQIMLLADVIKMNDNIDRKTVNNNSFSSDTNNNNNNHEEEEEEVKDPLKMGVKYHQSSSFNQSTLQRLEDKNNSSRSMSPKRILRRDEEHGQSMASVNGDNMNNKKRRTSIDGGLENNDDDDESNYMDGEDCGGDNDSVLSVGRDDENNFVEEGEDGDQSGRSSAFINGYKSSREDTGTAKRDHHSQKSIPCESPLNRISSPPAATTSANPSDKLNLGLSFRNIHNHLTSLKNYSPLENMFQANQALWKNSAFQAAMPSAFPGFAGHHPTAELLHRYDMLRGSLVNRSHPGMAEQNHNVMMSHRDMHDESMLKFSIDNILKADFGRRRITDPINKLRKISNAIIQGASIGNHINYNNNKQLPTIPSSPRHSSLSSVFDPMSPTSTTSNSSSSPVLRSPPPPSSTPMSTTSTNMSFGDSPSKLFSPMDLTASNGTGGTKAEAAAASESRTSTGSGTGAKAETTKSGAPMVWPAWVYCTRYSDRPSSG